MNSIDSADEPVGGADKRASKRGFRLDLWIRRIHLYSGLFMLPWVLLYGFTALLFNHPNTMTDGKTEVTSFELKEEEKSSLPSAREIAEEIVRNLNTSESNQGIEFELVDPESAVFTRRAFSAISEGEDSNQSVAIDLNTGKGQHRAKNINAEKEIDENRFSLAQGLKVKIARDNASRVSRTVSDSTTIERNRSQAIVFNTVPPIEFVAKVNGEKKKLRFSQSRRRSDSSGTRLENDQLPGKVIEVGANPREMSARSFLLRLHLAHGYPTQKNSRWFWAICVDLMFASMVFWGLSGLVMWWQIKKTRRLGFLILIASAVVAGLLAYGMHWQLANG